MFRHIGEDTLQTHSENLQKNNLKKQQQNKAQ